MADRYIDYWECLEYGRYLLDRLRTLDSDLVNMPNLIARIETQVGKVDQELANAGLKRSDKRTGRSAIESAVEAARAVRARFYYHLSYLPANTSYDFDAFFARKQLGDAARLKPDDLLSTMDATLRGFAAPANAALPGAAAWQQELAQVRDALAAAIKNRHGTTVQSIGATAGLVAARSDFLVQYRVAKRLVLSVLEDQGRSKEYRLFFRDLQVNESGPAGSDTGEDPDSELPEEDSRRTDAA